MELEQPPETLCIKYSSDKWTLKEEVSFGFRVVHVFSTILKVFICLLLICLIIFVFSAPPTFAESIFGPMNIQDAEDSQYTHGNLSYVPKYPVYNFVSKWIT